MKCARFPKYFWIQFSDGGLGAFYRGSSTCLGYRNPKGLPYSLDRKRIGSRINILDVFEIIKGMP